MANHARAVYTYLLRFALHCLRPIHTYNATQPNPNVMTSHCYALFARMAEQLSWVWGSKFTLFTSTFNCANFLCRMS